MEYALLIVALGAGALVAYWLGFRRSEAYSNYDALAADLAEAYENFPDHIEVREVVKAAGLATLDLLRKDFGEAVSDLQAEVAGLHGECVAIRADLGAETDALARKVGRMWEQADGLHEVAEAATWRADQQAECVNLVIDHLNQQVGPRIEGLKVGEGELHLRVHNLKGSSERELYRLIARITKLESNAAQARPAPVAQPLLVQQPDEAPAEVTVAPRPVGRTIAASLTGVRGKGILRREQVKKALKYLGTAKAKQVAQIALRREPSTREVKACANHLSRLKVAGEISRTARRAEYRA